MYALLLLLMIVVRAGAQQFDAYFEDCTLRVDYIFSGDNRHQQISVDELCCSKGWFGRRVNLGHLLLRGNGQIVMTDTLGRDTLYRHSFSTLFQEWQTTEEATRLWRSFENVFLLPMPRTAVNVTVSLTDTHNRVTSSLTHRVNPRDILLRPVGREAQTRWRYLRRSGDSREKIDVAFVAEGYRKGEMRVFLRDCRESIEALLAHEPFRSMADRFNFIAVMASSPESGVSIPHAGEWRNTVLGSNFDTFYSDRYLTTLRLKRLHDVLAGIPYEHIIILANTENYGGGGIYNSYLMSAAHNTRSRPVVVHEFGHSFAGLADEYYYDDQYETQYPADTEPWEPNLTTLVDFGSKWADMLESDQPVPTPPSGRDLYTEVGVYEGGGYQSRGVFRPSQECRMKTNESPVFCPVCERAIRRIIDYYTEERRNP
ncbi:MAG: IgA Peptidase M64 [Bacteroidaceae bacterium]|nr:IgA Peptidase M64 [Bacteroidaceae bacterium]